MRILALAGVVGLYAGVVFAQDYPTQPITIVVPFSAGGPTDTVTRLVAEPMSKALGQQVAQDAAVRVIQHDFCITTQFLAWSLLKIARTSSYCRFMPQFRL